MEDASQLRIEARRAEAEGDYDRACRLYLRALSATEADESLPDAGLLVRVGDLEHRQGDAGGALTYYRRAVEAYAEQGLLTNAVAVCNKILRVMPDEYRCYARLAELHLDLGLTADARGYILEYDEAAYEDDGPEASVRALRSFLSREPDQEVALRAADRLDEAGRGDEAVGLLKRVWRDRVRGELEADALERGARELSADVDPESWARPEPRLQRGSGIMSLQTGEGGSASDPGRGDLGERGVLAEVDGEDGPSSGPPMAILQTLARVVEHRDLHTERRGKRVGELSARLAEELGLREGQVELIRHAAPLHDIGMVVVPDRVLLKEGDLTPEEREIMKTHAVNGARILSEGDLPVLRLASEVARTHHEHWDGEGYPHGVAGEEIPLAGRIVAVADAFQALTDDRPFREARSAEEALEEIRRAAGRQFDARVVDALVAVRGEAPPEPADEPRLEVL